jgi:hypothetical protein
MDFDFEEDLKYTTSPIQKPVVESHKHNKRSAPPSSSPPLRSAPPPPQFHYPSIHDADRYEEDSEAPEPHPRPIHHDRNDLLNGNINVFDAVGNEIKDKWVPIVPDEFDIEKLDQEETEVIEDKTWCFLCLYSEATTRNTDYAYIRYLYKIVRENWEKMSRRMMAKMIVGYYRTRICGIKTGNSEPKATLEFKDNEGNDIPLKPWPLKQAIYHFILHQPDPQILLEEEIKTLHQIQSVIRNHELFEQNEATKDCRINKQALGKFMSVSKRLEDCQKRATGNRSNALM